MDLLVAHRGYTMQDLWDMPLYWRHKILYNFMEEKKEEKRRHDESRAKSNSK